MTGKERYNEIVVPKKLDEVFEKACERGRNKKRYDNIKGIVSVAAAIIIAFTISNVPTTYAALESVPVIGTVVRLFHIGEGGTITDGSLVHNEGLENTLKIWFSQENEYQEVAPYYQVTYKQTPNRIEILLSGVRGFDPSEFVEQAEQLPGVKKAYREVYLDDSAILLVVELGEGMSYEMKEYKDPGYLEISILENIEQEVTKEVFFLRSEKMEMGEEIACLKERYQEFDPNIARTQDDSYIVTIGAFDTKEEAEQAFTELQDKKVDDTVFTIDHCNNQNNPE